MRLTVATGRLSSELSNKIANMGLVAALLVVTIHLESAPRELGSAAWNACYLFRSILAIVAVPYFFMSAGFFLARHVGEPGWWRKAVVQRVRSLGVPFVFWCTVAFILFTFVWPVDTNGGECGRVQLRATSVAAAYGLNIFTVPEACRPLWFLRALFLLVVISPLVAWMIDRMKWGALAVFFVIYWTLNPGMVNTPEFWLSVRGQVLWKFGFSLEGLFYFAVGMFLCRRPLRVSRRLALVSGIVGFLIGIVGMLVKGAGKTELGYLGSLSIPFVLTCLWTFMPDKKWPRWLVGNAFAVYLIHPLITHAANASGLLPSSAFSAVVEWTLAVAGSLAIAELLRRFLPRLSELAFGGR